MSNVNWVFTVWGLVAIALLLQQMDQLKFKQGDFERAIFTVICCLFWFIAVPYGMFLDFKKLRDDK